MRRPWTKLRQDERGAVAPTVALSLVGLLAAGGIAFDYSRLTALDTELQDAADQAALAAASQLDGQSNACARASAAAVNLVNNQSLFANETSSRAITVTDEPACDGTGNIQFYQSYDQSTDIPGTAATSDANAKVVLVKVNGREAVFSLTPIVARFRSGTIGAEAVASLNTSICKVPPLMICNPDESGDPSFTIANYRAKGMKLVQGGSGSWTPGNFGFLNHAGGSNGDTGLREDIGWNAPPGDCQAGNGVDTKPGVNAVDDAINTRFDIYDGNTSCVGSGTCSPSINSVKDVVRAGNANGNNACKLQSQGWHLSSNYYGNTIPTSVTPLSTSTTPDSMGHPEDICHSVPSGTTGECAGPVGNGTWDRDAYFRVNYVRTSKGSSGQAIGTRWTSSEWQTNTGLSPSIATTAVNYASRYNVYRWEISNRGATVDGVNVLGGRIVSGSGASADTAYGLPQCSAGAGFGTGVVPTTTTVDRRKFVVAVANCATADHGGQVKGSSTGVTVTKWIDVFLVEPSLSRARSGGQGKKQIYGEIIGESVAGGTGTTVAQLIRHDVPYLIK